MNKGERVTFGRWPKEASCAPAPLEWIVLKVNADESVLLIASNAIECLPFNRECDYIRWENSTLRGWLNAGFANRAFDTEERQQLRVNESGDMVSCLTVDQARQLMRGDQTRQVNPTPYAQRRGSLAPSEWWLRSDRSPQLNMPFISVDGEVNGYGNFVDKCDVAVRPTILVALVDTGTKPDDAASTANADIAGGAEHFRDWSATDAFYLGIFPIDQPIPEDVNWEEALKGGYAAWLNVREAMAAGALNDEQRSELARAAAFHRLWNLSADADPAAFSFYVRDYWSKSRKTGQDPDAVSLLVRCDCDLDLLQDKVGALCVLAKHDRIEPLRLLAQHPVFATQENLQCATKAAQEAGSYESLSFLLQQLEAFGQRRGPAKRLEL